jgi:toxin ParE1/3/4
MSTLRFSLEAEQDINDIYDYLEERNPDAAARIVREMRDLCDRLSRLPGMGRRREELAPGLRSMPSDRYLIFYRETNGGIEIVRILHSSRNLGTFFSTD